MSDAFEIEESTITELQQVLGKQQLSASMLVDYYLARIEQLDSQLNAILSLNPKAKVEAAVLDAERASGVLRGPLHGIPIIVKDNIDTAQMPTTGGCKALATMQPPDDAFAITQLRRAGAIILGKANLHELACSGETVSSLGGQTCNPYNLDYTPGGSSGGTAAAIAANLATAGLGTDTINSVRSPASACNIVGLRPTAGLISRDGMIPVALSQDAIGPMGRTVADVAILLDAIAIDDPNDPMTARSAGQQNSGYQAALTEKKLKDNGLNGTRFGIIRSLFGQDAHHQSVNELMDNAFTTLGELGAHCIEIAINIDIDSLIDELSVTLWEGKLHLNEYLQELGSAAPVKSLKALLDSKQVHPSIQPMLKKCQTVHSPLGNSEYWQRLYPRRAELRSRLTQIFQQYQLDALVYPHQKQVVAPIGEPQKDRNGFLAAASGFPALTVPAGFAPSGLPVGLEFMAMPFQEARLLQMAYVYEQKTQWRRRPAL
ncbi:MAG: amidase family protein [Cyanobacteria bacterium J06559_1]